MELVQQAKAAGEQERQPLHNEIGQLKIDMNKVLLLVNRTPTFMLYSHYNIVGGGLGMSDHVLVANRGVSSH